MNGHQKLIALRRSGMKPACVWVHDDDCLVSQAASRAWHMNPNPFDGKVFAEIHIDSTDTPEALDLRCLVGMHVYLMSDRSEERARRMFKAIADAEPQFLVSVIGDEVVFHGSANG